MNHSAMKPDLVPAKVAASMICKSVDFLERLRRDGGGPEWYRIGDRIFYSRATLMQWLENCREKRPACGNVRSLALNGASAHR